MYCREEIVVYLLVIYLLLRNMIIFRSTEVAGEGWRYESM
jgi:hypothetical protein